MSDVETALETGWVVQVKRSKREGWWYWRLWSSRNRESLGHSQLHFNKLVAVRTARTLAELAGLDLQVDA